MKSGFYSLDTTIDENGNPFNNLLYAERFVAAPSYELRRELKDTYEYPVWNWYWFDSEEEAKAFFEITD